MIDCRKCLRLGTQSCPVIYDKQEQSTPDVVCCSKLAFANSSSKRMENSCLGKT